MWRLGAGAAGFLALAKDRFTAQGLAGWSERWLAPLALGWTLSVSQAPSSFWPILFVAGPLAFHLLLRAETARGAARIGWMLGVGYFVPGLSWIGEAFLVEADRFAWMRPFAILLLPMYLGLYWAAAFWAAKRFALRIGDGALPWPATVAVALILAGAWSLAELARAFVLTGFPWGMFAFAWIDAPTAQAAAWIGPYALNALTLLAMLAPYGVYLALRDAGRAGALCAAAGIAPLALLTLLGAFRPAEIDTPADAPIIRLVQPNIPQREKWAPELVDRNFAILLNISGGPADDGAPAMVIWPETATPYPVAWDAALRNAVMGRMPEGARLVFGALRGEPKPEGGSAVYNSLVALSAGPLSVIEAVYDKHHLVPFGEYLPFQDWLEAIGVFQLAGGRGGFAEGPGPQRIALPGLPSFMPLICYEAIFPQERLSLAERPDWLLQSTNDAWFGESSGPRQHLIQARFRAIEQGLPLFRAANTGISAGIDPYGRVIAALDLGQRGAIDLPLPRPLAPTLYVQWGEAPLLAILAMMVATSVLFRSRFIITRPER